MSLAVLMAAGERERAVKGMGKKNGFVLYNET
jgi:hypothetical protein